MKKEFLACIILAMLFALSTLTSCGEDVERKPDNILEEEYLTVEEVFKETGCKPTDVKNIKTLHLYKDKNDVKYLYGSKYKDDVESFWIAQYNTSGNQIWEIIKRDTEGNSRAHTPQQISNENIVVNNITLINNYEVKGASPVIITKEGEANFIDIFKNYYYSDLYIFDDFFFCDVDPKDLAKFPHIKQWCVQISNEGEILNQAESMHIPKGKTLWTSDSTYVNMDQNKIERRGIFSSPQWIYKVQIPTYNKCDMKLSLDEEDDLLSAIYCLTYSDNKQENISYNISYKFGVVPVSISKLTVDPHEIEIKLEETIPLTVKIEPIDATNKKIKWYSSNDCIVVDENGNITGHKEGEVYVIAESEDGGIKDSCKVFVNTDQIYFDLKDVNIINQSSGENRPNISNKQEDVKIIWESQNPSIVSVDNNGILKAKSIGTTVIKATIAETTKFATFNIKSQNVEDAVVLVAKGKNISVFSIAEITLHSRLFNNSISKIKYINATLADQYNIPKQSKKPNNSGYTIYDPIYMQAPISGSDLDNLKYWHVYYRFKVEGNNKEFLISQPVDGHSFGSL